MKTKLFLLVVLFVFSLSAGAQDNEQKLKIGAGAMVGLPMGDAGDVYSLAYGLDLMGEYGLAPSLALTLSIGYVDFAKKKEYSDMLNALNIKVKSGLIPVLAGVKYNFSEKLYGSLQAGLSFMTEKDSGSAFTFAPGVGFKVSDNLDLLLKYQSASKDGGSISFVGLRAGFTF